MSTGEPLTTFTVFPELPFELRLKIWHCIAQGPRTVTITYGSQATRHKGKTISRFDGWGTPEPAPIILHICHESRVEGLKSYQLAFGSHFHAAKIYFNFAADILRFGNGHEAEYLARDAEWIKAGPAPYRLDLFLAGGYYGGDDSEKVKYMVLDLDEEVYGRKYLFWSEIKDFTALKELTVLAWEDNDEAATVLMTNYATTLAHDLKQSPDWVAPKTIVRSSITGHEWGTLEVENGEVKMSRSSPNVAEGV
ncbi:hypothetical protein IFR04_002138 [Cadophora malorum]|uniref:2EXR domain-containing protein n=1 Tax=Cadophora malorum TaxID=108018 RepID=A0A8H8BUP9_9HELO|nr:hypothetical protein IFR04_002138 [Cadophora malorum]